MTTINSRHLATLPAACAVALLAARGLSAQMPGVPVLQNAFANPGVTVAVNYGRSDDVHREPLEDHVAQ